MKEYELIVHKVDSKGGVVGSLGPLYLDNDKKLNYNIEELIVNNKNEYRYVPEVHVVGVDK